MTQNRATPNQMALFAHDAPNGETVVEWLVRIKATKEELEQASLLLRAPGTVMGYPPDNWRVIAFRLAKFALGYDLKVGMGATVHLYSDSHACTVIAISPSGKSITLQRDTATINPEFKPDFHPGGFCGHVSNQHDQSYTYKADPEGQIYKARVNARGQWKVGGKKGLHVSLDYRAEFYDYNF